MNRLSAGRAPVRLWLAATAGGAICALAFAPYHLRVAMVLGLAPMLYASRRNAPYVAAVAAYLCFASETLAVCRWIYGGAANVMGAQYYAIALLAALTKAFPYALAALILGFLARFDIRGWPLFAGACFAAAENLVVSR